MNKKKKIFNLAITFGISIILLLLVIRRIDVSVVIENINSFNKGLMLLALLIWLFGYWVRAIRWKIFITPLSKTSLKSLFRVLVTGFALNNILPLRAGEFIRAFLMNKVNPMITKSSAFATIAGERVFDGIAVVLFTIIGALSIELPLWAQQAVVLGAILFLGVLVVFLGLVVFENQLSKILTLFLKPIPARFHDKLEQIVRTFIEGLSILKSFRKVISVFALSIGAWGVETIFFYLALQAFQIDVSLLNAAFIMGIINLGIMIPAAPGGIGTFEFITVTALLLFGVSESDSFSFAVVTHVIQNSSIIMLGLVFLSQIGLSVSQVVSTAEDK